jgi:hypothetical protein
VVDRRRFLQSGAAASLAGALSMFPFGSVAGEPALRFERFVFDRRYAEAVEAARLAAARGIRLSAIAGDLTSLWYHDLDLRWKRAPMTLAGVTTRGALFVLETFAADRGMRVLYRGEHGAASSNRPSEILGAAEHFAGLLPAALASDGGGAAASREEPLSSWIIAPRSTVAAPV